MRTRSKVFLDSNFFIYLINKDEVEKRKSCAELLLKLEKTSTIVISTQVIKEVSAVLLRKYNYPINDLKELIAQLEQFEVVETPPSVIKNALDIMLSYSISFWDAVICATAAHARCGKIISEDMNHDQTIYGAIIKNPFKL